MNLGKELAKSGKKAGMCKPVNERLKMTEDKDEMCRMFINGIDFCLANNFPSNDFIRANFTGTINKHGIHLDEQIKLVNERKAVLLGNCSGSIEIDGFSVSEIFIKHNSRVYLSVKENAFVMIDIFDNSTVIITATDNSKVVVNRYSGNVDNCETFGNAIIKIRDKHKNTY